MKACIIVYVTFPVVLLSSCGGGGVAARLLSAKDALTPTCRVGVECVTVGNSKICPDSTGQPCYDRFACALQVPPSANVASAGSAPNTVYCFDRLINSCNQPYCSPWTSALLPTGDSAGCCSGWRCNDTTGRCFDPVVSRGCAQISCSADSHCCDQWKCNLSTNMCTDPNTLTCAEPTCVSSKLECCAGYSCDVSTQQCFNPNDPNCHRKNCRVEDSECCTSQRCAPLQQLCFSPNIADGCIQTACSGRDTECCNGHRCNATSQKCFDPSLKRGCAMATCSKNDSECCDGFSCVSQICVPTTSVVKTMGPSTMTMIAGNRTLEPTDRPTRAPKWRDPAPERIDPPDPNVTNSSTEMNNAAHSEDGDSETANRSKSGGAFGSSDVKDYIGLAAGALAVSVILTVWVRAVRRNRRARITGVWDKTPSPLDYTGDSS